MPVGLLGEQRKTTSGCSASTNAVTSSASRAKSSRRGPSTQRMPTPVAMIGCIEYAGVKPAAVRPGPPNARARCWSTSFEPLAAHTWSAPTGHPVVRVRYAARSSRSAVCSRSGYRLSPDASAATARVTSSTTSVGTAYELSFVLSRTGTSICGAPYGSRPRRSSRSGNRSLVLTARV